MNSHAHRIGTATFTGTRSHPTASSRAQIGSPDIKAYHETAGRLKAAAHPRTALIRVELPKWREIVKKAGIKPG